MAFLFGLFIQVSIKLFFTVMVLPSICLEWLLHFNGFIQKELTMNKGNFILMEEDNDDEYKI